MFDVLFPSRKNTFANKIITFAVFKITLYMPFLCILCSGRSIRVHNHNVSLCSSVYFFWVIEDSFHDKTSNWFIILNPSSESTSLPVKHIFVYFDYVDGL